MPELPLVATGLSITKTRHLLAGAADVTFDLTAGPNSSVFAALQANDPFPAGKIELDSTSVKVRGERSVPLGGAKGTVSFSGQASAYQRLAVLDEPAEVTALLVRDGVNDDLAQGLRLSKGEASRFLLLRWGYELQGAARGALGLGVGGKVTFGAEGKRLGAYAVIREIAATDNSLTALTDLFQAWMLPSQFSTLEDLAAGTWIVAEIDGSIALSLGAEYGYDFNWVRESIELGGLSGDIGLKVQVGVNATFGFEASGQYALALGRPPGTDQIRVQLFRLNRKGINLAYSAGATAQGSFGGLLPDHFDGFVSGVFGLHGLQVLKELDNWTAPDRKITDLLANVSVKYAEDFLGKVTGVDAATQFNDARARLVSLLTAWHALPHRVAAAVYSLVEHEAPGLAQLKQQLNTLSTENLVDFQPEFERLLSHVEFFRTPFGKWLESAVLTSVLTAASDAAEYARVQSLAQQTLQVLDGAALEGVLVRLQRELGQRLGLDRIEQIIDTTTFDKADEWLKARLSAFLGERIDFAKLDQLRVALHRLLALRERFFQQAKTALTRKYEFQLLGTYQKTTTRTALLDVVFDFAAPHADAGRLTRLVAAAIDGDFDLLLAQDVAGVSLKSAALTHDIKRQTHLEVTLPFTKVVLDEINTSLAKLDAVQSESGRLVIYDLHADDLKTARGKFSSRFTVDGRFVLNTATRIFDSQSMSHSYTFRQAVRRMRRRALETQLKTYVDSYFPTTFGTGEASFQTWVADLDRTVDQVLNNGPDNFGNTLLALEVSAPSAFVAAWGDAPSEESADAYVRMSKAIQAQLRKLIPLAYFQDLSRFKDLAPSAALLVYASLPPTTSVVVSNGHIVQFDERSDIYPNIEDDGTVRALVEHSLTLAALVGRLTTVHDVLTHAEGTGSFAGEYRPDRIARVIANALTDIGRADLLHLLRVERSVIREARNAGIEFRRFLDAGKHAAALQHLAKYGSHVTSAFNSKIGSLFSGREIRPLGTLVFLEAARAFKPTLASARPSAMLELTVLKENPSFDLTAFPDSGDVPVSDVVNAQKFVALA
jgi:hypothetical protein